MDNVCLLPCRREVSTRLSHNEVGTTYFDISYRLLGLADLYYGVIQAPVRCILDASMN
jgi:hypothetical protein